MRFIITKTYRSVTVQIVSDLYEELSSAQSLFSSVDEYDNIVIECMEASKIKLINEIKAL